MLTKFAVRNFRGFSDWIELDFSNPSEYHYNEFAIRNGIVKDAMIYGPNGSGKSNLGFAMFDLVSHLTQKHNHPLSEGNFCYANNGKPVEFSYEFKFEDNSVSYSYSKDSNRSLLTESFKANGVEYFSRTANSVTINEDLFTIQPTKISELEMGSNSVSIVSYLIASYPLEANNPLIQLNKFVENMLWFRCLEDRGYIGFENGATRLEQYIISSGRVKDFQDFLFKLSGQQFQFKDAKEGDEYLICDIDGNEVPFNQIRSTGTDSMLLLYYWYTKMDKVSLVFLDEFDAFYHYELSYEISKLLFDLDIQVILTTHNTALMTNDLLRPDCYFLINGKVVKPIVSCTKKELRLGHNLEKLYRGGGFEL